MNKIFDLNLPTPVDIIEFEGNSFYLKRDDLISNEFSGNKGRKFYSLLKGDFSNIDTLISYGSNQSNAMYSLSVLAKIKGWRFIYYTNHIPKYLQDNPVGNYKGALENSAEFIIGSPPAKDELDSNILFIEEGGRDIFSEDGIYILAKEIKEWLDTKKLNNLNIFLPSGTGTTALFLSRYFIEHNLPIKVYTTPCVGDKIYLKKQFSMLEANDRYYPTILDLAKKYHFGKLYREFYEIWLKLRSESGVEFDMLYDPKGWLVVLNHLDILGSNTLYIHQGGLLGNESMLPRYKRKFNL